MRRRSKLALAALTAATVLAAAVGTAAANRLSISSQQIRVTFQLMTFTAGTATIGCDVTLEGSFHESTIAKVEESLVGYITHAVVDQENCQSNVGARVSAQAETLPWHLQYQGFEGELPNINEVQIAMSGFAFTFLMMPGVGSCHYGGAYPWRVIPEMNGTILRPNETVTIPKIAGSGLCPSSAFFASALPPITVLGSTTAVTLSLV